MSSRVRNTVLPECQDRWVLTVTPMSFCFALLWTLNPYLNRDLLSQCVARYAGTKGCVYARDARTVNQPCDSGIHLPDTVSYGHDHMPELPDWVEYKPSSVYAE